MDSTQTKCFLNKLDILADRDQEQKFEKATPEKIQEIINDMGIFDENGQKFTMGSSISKFRKFGPGVFLMFTLLKYISILFGILSLITFVQFFLLMKSPYYQGYEKIVRMNLLRLTIASLQPQSYQVYIFFDFLVTCLFLGWLIWWKQSEEKLVNYCNQYLKLPSYLTVTLDNIPQHYSEDNFKRFLQQGKDLHVQQIYTSRSFLKSLQHYKQLTQLANQFRVDLQLSERQMGAEDNDRNIKDMVSRFIKLHKKYGKISQQKFNYKKFEPNKVFIILKNYYERQLALKRYSRFSLCQKKFNNQENLYEGQAINLSPCSVEPDAIAWQNLGVPLWQYLLRALIVFLILSFVTCIGIIIIFILEILETASIGDAYYFSQKKSLKGSSSNEDYCLSLSPSFFLTQQNNQCKQFTADYFKLAILIILAPFAVFLCKKMIMFILSHLVKFRKYSSDVQKIKSQIMTLSLFYFIVSAVLHLVLYLKAKHDNTTLSLYEILYPLITRMFWFADYNPASIHLYSDFSLDWYKQATFFIIIICATSFNIANCWKLMLSAISHNLQIYKAKKQTIVYRVKQKLHGGQLHIEGVYSSAIAIIYFSLLYCSAIPITMMFGFVSLVVLFFVSKYIFVKHSERLIKMSHSVNTMVTYILMGGVVVHCIMAPILFGAPEIGVAPKGFDQKSLKGSSTYDNEVITIGQRYIKFGPYYITIVCILVVYIVFRKYFKILFKKIKKMIKKKLKKQQNSKKSEQNPSSIQNPHNKSNSQYYGLYPSYSMHYNKKYAQILKNIYIMNNAEARRVTCAIDKNLKTFLSSYNSNQESVKPEIQDFYGSAAIRTNKNVLTSKVLFYRMIASIERNYGCELNQQSIINDQTITKVIPKENIIYLQQILKFVDPVEQQKIDPFSMYKHADKIVEQTQNREKQTKDRMFVEGDHQEQAIDENNDVQMPAESDSRLHKDDF